jgi:NifU-like protein
MEDRAKKLVDEVLAPLIKADGGEIELVGVVDKRVLVRLSGAYSGCPSRSFTLSRVIEPLFKKWLGDEVRVEAVAE